MKPTLEEHFTPAQVAERLKVTPRTVARWMAEGLATRGKAGLYPVRKLGRRVVRIPASAVERFFSGVES